MSGLTSSDGNIFQVPPTQVLHSGTFSLPTFPSGLTQSDSDDFSHMQADRPAQKQSSYMTPPQKKRRKVDNPDQGFKKLAKVLKACVTDNRHDDDDNNHDNDDHDHDDAEVLSSLALIWAAVNGIRKDDKLCATLEGFQKNVERMGEDVFVKWLKGVVKKESWRELLQHEVFSKTKCQSQVDTLPYKDATHRAWDCSFKGNAAAVLLETIKVYLDRSRETYSRHTSIVNSSGTGKSRMVDENAYRIVTIPMCLRDGIQGYPPPDEDLRDWFRSIANTRDQNLVARSLHGFVTSLLKVLWTHLQEIDSSIGPLPVNCKDVSLAINRHEKLAYVFRERMTAGQTFSTTNDYRKSFYDGVIKMAKEFAATSQPQQSTNPDSPYRYIIDGKGTQEAASDLCEFIDPLNLLDKKKGPRRPHVILAFDESHVLTDNPEDEGWNLFSELRRTLRTIRDLPIFSLFLSTAGRFRQFSPDLKSDPSNRIAFLVYPPLDPISEVSFDDLAFPAKEDTVDLDRVVQMDWIAHLGRPLFASVYDEMGPGRDTMILELAKQKLLDNKSILEPNDGPGALACLSVRFDLEFKSDEFARHVACTQVERHMRMCVAATTGFGRLVTIAGSEPLLAEAAYHLMKHNKVVPVRYLAQHSDLNCVHLGHRGELVAALIIMQARDAAANKNRWMSVTDFMKELLPSEDYDKLLNSRPRFWRKDEDKPFGKTFENYAMWFNHVVKVDDLKSLKSEHVWKFITRGAMIVCANNQEGVDIFLPITPKDRNISRHVVSGMLIQIKNREDLVFNKVFFDAINPIQLGLFSKQQTRPIIRVVFSLGSDQPGVLFPPRRQSECHHPDPFTTFDVWCSGLSNGTPFKCISEDADVYNHLLKRSLQLDEAFEVVDKEMSKELKKAREGLRRKMAPLRLMSIPEHNLLHL